MILPEIEVIKHKYYIQSRDLLLSYMPAGDSTPKTMDKRLIIMLLYKKRSLEHFLTSFCKENIHVESQAMLLLEKSNAFSGEKQCFAPRKAMLG